MHFGVTVDAIALEHGRGGTGGRDIFPAARRTRMKRRGMAFLAHLGATPLQHAPMWRTVGIMAIQAAFPNRVMFPDEGSPKFRMTGITGLIHGAGKQIPLDGTAVRIVTVHATHAPFQYRVTCRTMQAGSDVGVTVHADGIPGFTHDDRIISLVGCVAADTAYLAEFMSTAMPVSLVTVVVTGQARLILHRSGFIRAEADSGRRPSTVLITAKMGLTGPVTTLASHPGSRGSRHSLKCVHGVEDAGNGGIVIMLVAHHAGTVATFCVSFTIMGRSPLPISNGLHSSSIRSCRIGISGGYRVVVGAMRARKNKYQKHRTHFYTPLPAALREI